MKLLLDNVIKNMFELLLVLQYQRLIYHYIMVGKMFFPIIFALKVLQLEFLLKH